MNTKFHSKAAKVAKRDSLLVSLWPLRPCCGNDRGSTDEQELIPTGTPWNTAKSARELDGNLLERSPRTNDLRLWINQSLLFSWVYPALAKPPLGPVWQRS